MGSEEVVDLKQQLIGLFDKEDVLAFFDFQLVVDPNETVQGLCKISGPKEGESKSNYLSLLFIIDTVDETREEKVDSLMKRLSWSEFKRHSKGVDMIIFMPHVNHDTWHYLAEIELYLNPDKQITRSYIADELYPSILKTLGCSGHELVFWDELLLEKRNHERTDAGNETDRSLIDRIVGYFKGK